MNTDPLSSAAAPAPPQEQVPQHVIDFAVEVSGWSPCRSKRGVVLFKDGDIVNHGHNYKPRGFDCDGSAACKATCRVEAIHAEQHALFSAGNKARGLDMLHVKTVDGALVPSGGPSCVQCSKLALVAGIAGVWLYHIDGWKRYDTADFHALSLEAAAPSSRDGLREHPVAEFMHRLGDVESPEIALEADGDLSLDWFCEDGACFSVSLSRAGKVTWAALRGAMRASGHFVLPDWPESFTTALAAFLMPLPPAPLSPPQE